MTTAKRRSPRLLALLTLIATLALGCGSESDGGGTGPSCIVSNVSISPAQLSLTVGEAGPLSATVTSTNCASPPALTWSGATASVGVVANGATAQVTGLAATPSPVTITATAGGVSGSAQVTVSAPLPSTIVFTDNSGVNRQIWRMDPNGANRILLSQGGFDDYSPALSPDGSRIAFVNAGDLTIMNADGSGATFVTGGTGQVITPSWAPSGTQLAYSDVTNSNFFTGKADLKIVTTAGVPVRTLVAITRWDVQPAWAPNGATITFADGDSPLGCCNLLQVPALGGATHLLFDGSGFMGDPSYSPDGSLVAYHEGFEVFVIPAAGGTPVPLTPGRDASHPTWSPDGSRIAFMGVPAGGTLNDIWVMNADGSNIVNITNTPTIDEIQPSWGIKVGSPSPGIRASAGVRQSAPRAARSGNEDPRTRRLVSMLASRRTGAAIRR